MLKTSSKDIDTNTKTIAQVLRNCRINSGLSLREVAEQAEVDHSYISKIESGLRWPSWHVLGKIAEVYGKTANQIIILTGAE